MIDPSFSYLGATPDGIVMCDCCGKGVLEVKCPYQCRADLSFQDASEVREFCLEKNCDGSSSLLLCSNHSYFYQIHLQMRLCSVSFCYFVVSREVFIIKIDRNDCFLEAAINKDTKFFRNCILPELMYSHP